MGVTIQPLLAGMIMFRKVFTKHLPFVLEELRARQIVLSEDEKNWCSKSGKTNQTK